MLQAAIAGGGIGGLAGALALSRAGWDVRVFERAGEFSEVGAGIQMGPNVVRILKAWGLGDALCAVAAFPERLEVRSVMSGERLAAMPLGDMAQRYGAPYATIHRADLHGLLLDAVNQTGARIHLDRPLASFAQTAQAVTIRTAGHPDVEADALVGADGVRSLVRSQLLADGPPPFTGHLAYRALLRQADLPAHLRTQNVTAWLGRRMHVVQYPVCRGESLNVVALVEGAMPAGGELWDHQATAAGLHAALEGSCTPLRELMQAPERWRLWPLHGRTPMRGPQEHAVGRVALLGDAAHPMLPYLAQGAGMAIEDAAALGRVLAQAIGPAQQAIDVQTLLQRFALNRWQRNARVQARAQRNGVIFHAQGPLRLARDASMRLLGPRLLDMPWLYGAAASV
ncbi:MAG: FAD-dependent oxidoreductase [Comamonadaceae bacterium]|nr:MAG: FAD-dependent oxidoreductase [Comamonadaceae bacterium]